MELGDDCTQSVPLILSPCGHLNGGFPLVLPALFMARASGVMGDVWALAPGKVFFLAHGFKGSPIASAGSFSDPPGMEPVNAGDGGKIIARAPGRVKNGRKTSNREKSFAYFRIGLRAFFAMRVNFLFTSKRDFVGSSQLQHEAQRNRPNQMTAIHKLAESFALTVKTLKNGRVKAVHPITGKWVYLATTADVYALVD